MAFSARQFLSEISTNGIIQPNRYQVEITAPEAMRTSLINGTSVIDTTRMLLARAESARLPGISIMTSDVNRFGVGPLQKMPFNVAFTETSLTFIADKNGFVYRYFYTWMNRIFDFTGSGFNRTLFSTIPTYTVEYKDRIATDVKTTIYDSNNNARQSVTLYKAFPISFNEVPLEWARENELMRFTVNFAFTNWSLNDVTTTF